MSDKQLLIDGIKEAREAFINTPNARIRDKILSGIRGLKQRIRRIEEQEKRSRYWADLKNTLDDIEGQEESD